MLSMKKIYFAFTALTLFSASIWAANLPVTVTTDPAYPTKDGQVTVYLNTNHWPAIDTSNMGVYTGLITSQSSDIVNAWEHVVPNSWGDNPDSLEMKRVNDTVYSFTIPNISQFYNVVTDEDVFRITFIVRDKTSHQTENLYFEVFGKTPVDSVSTLPLVPTSKKVLAVNINVNKTTGSLKALMVAHPDSAISVYAYTATTTNFGAWKHEVTPWGSVGTNNSLKCISVSDSIYRLYITPSVNSFYKIVNPAEASKTLNFVFRNQSGGVQTENLFVPMTDTTPAITAVNNYLIYPPYPTVNDNIFIFVNANKFNFNPKSTLSAWTGLITSTSKDIANDWQKNPISSWTNTSIGLTRLNDSVHYLNIPSIATFYKLDVIDTTVFRIAFIARDTVKAAISKQTQNIYFEIFGKTPVDSVSTLPLVPTSKEILAVNLNVNRTTGSLKALMVAHPDSAIAVYAYTATTTNFGPWKHEVTPWGNVGTNNSLKCVGVSDSIFRLYIAPSVNSFYKIVNPAEASKTLNFVFRNQSGSVQAENLFVPMADTTPALAPVEDYSIYPKYPTVSDNIFIFFNANKYKFNPKSSVSAWTGLITSTSKDMINDWQKNPISIWSNTSIGLTRLNDSIHYLNIPSITSFYKLDTKDTDVFRIAFIARDTVEGAVKDQTPNIYFEIYDGQPTILFQAQPALPKSNKLSVITFNIKKSSASNNLFSNIATTDTVYAYTGLGTSLSANASDWTNVISAWGAVGSNANLRTLRQSDSVFRFYLNPGARSFYNVPDTCVNVKTANFILRNASGSHQTDNIFVPFDTTAYKSCPVSVSPLTIPSLSIYPNPAADYIVVKSAKSITDISVMNVLGQKVLQMNNLNSNNVSVTLNSLGTGLYIVSVKTADNVISNQKLIKK